MNRKNRPETPCPPELTAQDVWDILADYVDDVSFAEGVLFSENEYVELAFNQMQGKK